MECLVCDPAKIILTSKFSYSLFSNPPLKLRLGLPIGGTLLITNQLANYYYWSIRRGSSGQIVFIALLFGWCKALGCLVPVSANCTKMLGQIHFAHQNGHVLTFLHRILMYRVTYWAPVELVLEWYFDSAQCYQWANPHPNLSRKKQKQIILYKIQAYFQGFYYRFLAWTYWAPCLQRTRKHIKHWFVPNTRHANNQFLFPLVFSFLFGSWCTHPTFECFWDCWLARKPTANTHKGSTTILQVSVWKRLSWWFAQAPAQPAFGSSHHSHSTTGSHFWGQNFPKWKKWVFLGF